MSEILSTLRSAGWMLIAAWTLAGTACTTQDYTALTPAMTVQGSDSRIEAREIHLVKDLDSWRALWKRHRPEEPAPRVDFAKHRLLAVFQGKSWNSDGLRGELQRLDKHLRLRFDDLSYQTAGPDGGGIRCTAYGIWVFANERVPIVVEENVQGYIGASPIWKLRARFDAAGNRLKT